MKIRDKIASIVNDLTQDNQLIWADSSDIRIFYKLPKEIMLNRLHVNPWTFKDDLIFECMVKHVSRV